MGLKNQILSADDLTRQPLETKAWGKGLFIRELSGLEMENFIDKSEEENGSKLICDFVSTILVDENGKKIITAKELKGKSSKVMRDIFNQGMKFNGVDEEKN